MPIARRPSIATGTGTSIALPTHETGDLIVIVALRFGNTNPPGLASGYTNLHSPIGPTGSASSVRVGWKVAASAADTSGTWSSATDLIAIIYRDVDATPFGTPAATLNRTATSVRYNGLTLGVGDGSSWVFSVVIAADPTATLSNTHAAMNIVSSGTFGSGARAYSVADTNGGVATFAQEDVGVGVSTQSGSFTVEMLASASGIARSVYFFFLR